MARRKAAIHPLPDWFDLRAYNVLLTLTNEQLFEELTFRLFGIIQSKNTDEWLPAISSKNVLIASTSKSTLGLCPNPHIEKLVLYEGASIQPLDFDRVESLHNFAKSSPWIFKSYADDEASFMAFFLAASMSIGSGRIKSRPGHKMRSVSLFMKNGCVDVSIDLERYTDKEILTDLTELLPMWRRQMEHPEQDKKASGSIGERQIIKKIINYQVIPMFDLSIWSMVSGFAYTAEQFSRVLYPDEIVTAKQVTESRFPFVMKFLNDDWIDMARNWLRETDRGTGKRNGERLVSDTIEGIG